MVNAIGCKAKSFLDDVDFTERRIGDVLRSVDVNKAKGDLITILASKYSHEKLVPLLATCFTGFTVHGIVPDSNSVLLVPVRHHKAAYNSIKP